MDDVSNWRERNRASDVEGDGTSAPHRGACIDTESESYDLLLQWLKEGAKPDQANTVKPESIEVLPKQAVFASPQGLQKIVVLARFSDGTQRDVTEHTVFSATTSPPRKFLIGVGTSLRTGSAFVLARYDQFTQGASIIVRPEGTFQYSSLESNNEIDRLVDKRLQFLHIAPPLCAVMRPF